MGPTVLGAGTETPTQVLGTKTVRPSRTVGALPTTGANIGTIAAVGAGLVAAGAAMAARRDREGLAVDGPEVDDTEAID